MARFVAGLLTVAIVLTTAPKAHALDEDLGATVDLTGVDGSDQAGVGPAGVEPDLTVGDRRAQEFEPAYGVWDRLADCEASGNWHSASNPIYKGGLQFDATTWRRHGGLEFAWRADFASRAEQITVAQRTLAAQGWGAWPVCSRRLGLR
jgi:hypothetical protein